jgi:hypothetical protein
VSEYNCGECGVPDEICDPHNECVADVWSAALKNKEAEQKAINNARDEIAAIIAEYSSHKYIGCESCVRIIKRLRQLSPVA